MAVRIQFRRGLANDWYTANPLLEPGELGYETDNKTIKIGDGINRWNTLAVAAAGDIMAVKAGTGLTYGPLTDDAGDSGTVELAIDTNVVLTADRIDSKGDLIAGTGPDAYAVLHVGANGTALIADSTTSTGLKWGTLSDPTISNGFITADKLASNSVTTVKIADGAVTTAKVADLNVTTAKLADGSVTTAKIADTAVTAAKITDGSISTTKLANSAVTLEKMAAGSVSKDKVDGSIYQRVTPGSSARIFIQSTTPSGAAGDIWFKY